MRQRAHLFTIAIIAGATLATTRHAVADNALDKKAEYLAAKRVPQRAVVATRKAPSLKRTTKPSQRRTAKPPEVRLVNLHNLWTKEWLVVELPTQGDVLMPPTALIRRFLRCHFTNEMTAMDERPMRLALEAAQHFKVDTIDVISGFRAPKYNLMLRKKGREVARDSQHTKGNAMDIRLPSIAPRTLARWAKSQKLGGVGIYRDSGFVHVDTGPIRSWSGR